MVWSSVELANRQLNAAIHRIAPTRSAIAYLERRAEQGEASREWCASNAGWFRSLRDRYGVDT